jgi:hypothetical protein
MLAILFESTSIKGRFVLYGSLAAIALLTFSDEFLSSIFFDLGIAYLVGIPAWYLLTYLPLIDWPLLAWRRTQKRSWVLIGLCLALVMPVGLPLIVGIQKRFIALVRIQEFQLEDKPLSIPPFKPASILILDGRNLNQSTRPCGELCRALVWSGEVQRIVVVPDFPENGVLKNALEYRIDQDSACAGKRTEDHRRNKCILGAKVDRQQFDAAITLRRFYDPSLQVYHSRPATAFEQQVRLYDCRKKCVLVAAQATATGQRLGFPFGVAFKLEYPPLQPITQEFEVGNYFEFVRRAFLLDLRSTS